MNREEASFILANIDRRVCDDELNEALDMAIKVLEQEKCEDAISRQAALESIKNLYPDMPVVDIMGSRRKWLDKYAPYFECENAVEQLPSVNPKVKTGHWTIKENGHAKCSKCLVVQPYSSIFCPNCGAKMVEPQERSDKDADKKCTYKETGCGSCKRQLDCPIEADKAESEG